ncbi:MAG TPA: DUF402 domain-containing protein [Anaerolineales bacterium]|nr:DUF402 domain-containing protein [Anaerolineales bacterium]
MAEFWKPGDVIVWRGIYRDRVWNAMPTFVVKDSLQEVVLALIPGAFCTVEETYIQGKKHSKHFWDFKDTSWTLGNFIWHTNRLLFIVEPEKYYSIILFWNHETNEFIGHYVNFQLPFRRSSGSLDTLDLELDIDINPDFSYRWKDVPEYEEGIASGVILPEWVQAIDDAKPEILERLQKRQYPFNGSWLDWTPNPSWSPPTLPENWDKI